MKPSHTFRAVFDDPNLVSSAGLVPVLQLAKSAGWYELLEGLSVPSPRAAVKVSSVVGGMLAGAASIDDLDLLRHGAMGRLFDDVRAPSTLGTFLRSFSHGHVQQLDRAGAALLVGLGERVRGLLGGAGARSDELVMVDIDDTVRAVYGHTKQGAAFGYTGVRGLNVQLATLSSDSCAPVIAQARLRSGNAAAQVGAPRLIAQALNIARRAGITARLMVRADSAFYWHKFLGAIERAGAWFSITVRMNRQIQQAISAIDPESWHAIKYQDSVWDEREQRWVSDAELAEVPFVAFTRRASQRVTCRLIVRRVKRLIPRTEGGSAQGELFDTYRYHAFITNSDLPLVIADKRHREHAIIEQVIAELKNGPLAHLPSGKYAANAAWVACAAIAFNLARAAAVACERPRARWATIRTRIINIPARVARTARRVVLHLPTDWKWQRQWHKLWHHATGPPTALS